MNLATYNLDIWFILDKDSAFIAKKNGFNNIIINSEELKGRLDDKQEPDIVIILAEAKHELQADTVFYGFDLASELRRKYRLLCPIVITSSFEREVFEVLSRKNQEKFNILYGSGTAFLHLPVLYKKLKANDLKDYLESMPSISDAVIEDMIEMLLQQKGFLIDRITHDLKFSLNAAELKAALDTIGSYMSSGQKSELNYSNLSSEIIQANQQEVFNAAREDLVDACDRYLEQGNHESTLDKEEVIGKVLIVEDDPDQRKRMKARLQNHFQLEITGDGRKALDILKADTENNILAIIADWRLLKYDEAGKKTDYWQDFQGYQVLEAAARSHFAALISLTAERDKNVHQIRNRLGIAILLFKKQHIYASGGDAQWGMFMDIVRDKCIEIISLISSIPTAANWRKYADQYRKVRLAAQWSAFEHEVTKQANKYWQYFKDTLDLQTRANVNQGLQDFFPLNELENVLIGRRLFFALYYEFLRLRNDATLSFNPEQIIRIEGEERGSVILDTYAVLRNNWWKSDVSDKKGEFERYNQASKNLLKDLCLKSEEIHRMFPEEKAWLTKQGIDYSLQKVIFETEQDDSYSNDDEPEDSFEDKEPTVDDIRNIEIPKDEV